MERYFMIFFGSDGEMEYVYGRGGRVEFYFRTPRVSRLSWTFDGMGWSSELTELEGNSGKWYITHMDNWKDRS